MSATRAELYTNVEILRPEDAIGIVLIARGDGNLQRRLSFSTVLREARLATAVCDVLTPYEQEVAHPTHRAPRNVRLLRDRLASAIDAVRQQADDLPLAIVAAGTLAAAALDAAALRPLAVDALVLRNARLDLATSVEHVQAPTLLIAATDVPALVCVMEDAFRRLACPKQFDVIPASASLAEDGRYLLCAELARNWIVAHLRAPVVA